MPNGGLQTAEDRMSALLSQAGIPWGVLTPQQQFSQYASTQFRPGPSGLRSAFYDVADPLLQQHYLSQPFMPTYGGFAEFMGGGGTAANPFGPGAGDLRARAEQAALMARTPAAQFYQYVDPQPIGTEVGQYAGPAITPEMRAQFSGMSPAQQLLYRQRYGTGEQAAANQAQLANLLALQRGGGDMYGGPMGQAITGALGELRGQVLAQNPEANFLDWYLSRTEGGQGLGGFLTGPAATPPVVGAPASMNEFLDNQGYPPGTGGLPIVDPTTQAMVELFKEAETGGVTGVPLESSYYNPAAGWLSDTYPDVTPAVTTGDLLMLMGLL